METTLQPGSVDAAKISRLVAQLDSIGEATPRLVGPDGYEVDLPVELYSILRSVAVELKAGNGVAVIPVSAVMTTAQAAEMLNVSRPHVVKLIDNGDITHHMSGTHRRVRIPDLLAYMDKRDKDRNAALAAMHAIADEAGMDL